MTTINVGGYQFPLCGCIERAIRIAGTHGFPPRIETRYRIEASPSSSDSWSVAYFAQCGYCGESVPAKRITSEVG